MSSEHDVKQAIIGLNQAYLAAAAELCRQDRDLASVVLHLDPEDVQQFARTTVADFARLSDVSIALVRPHMSMRAVLGAQNESDLNPVILAAIHERGRS